jgi:arabinose-5-phosphate isomerase
MQPDQIIATARRTIQSQARSVADLEGFIQDDFVHAVERISVSKGRLVVSGIGKSAIIAQKLVATLNSTGTPALFMHAADAIHGDLGMIRPEDIVLIISKSGDSPEIKLLIPLIRGFGNVLIGMGGNLRSHLAQQSDFYLNTTIEQESCPNNLAPTNSTTAQLVMGDALAVCLMEMKGFASEDFARFHPGGALGKKLYLRVADLMHVQAVLLQPETPVKQIILEITRNRLGAVAIQQHSGEIAGIITDGDIRRMLEKHDQIAQLSASDVMSMNPRSIASDALAAEALNTMRTNNINQLLVHEGNKLAGIIHIQDLIREGII